MNCFITSELGHTFYLNFSLHFNSCYLIPMIFQISILGPEIFTLSTFSTFKLLSVVWDFVRLRDIKSWLFLEYCSYLSGWGIYIWQQYRKWAFYRSGRGLAEYWTWIWNLLVFIALLVAWNETDKVVISNYCFFCLFLLILMLSWRWFPFSLVIRRTTILWNTPADRATFPQ